MISLDIDGEPIPWKRAGQKRLRNYVINYDTQKKDKERIRLQIREQYKGIPLEGPLRIDFWFFMPIPKSTSKKLRKQMMEDTIRHEKKPDLDNLEKFILDCMTGYIYVDDAQVTMVYKEKLYRANAGTLIHVTPLSNIEEFCLTFEECKNEKDKRSKKNKEGNGGVQKR